MKKAINYQDMINNLINKDLVISDTRFALKILEKTNYYRFSSYFKYFLNENNKFKTGISFESIYFLYEFDKKLKNLFVFYLEEVEIKLKSKIAYYLAHTFDSDFLYFNFKNWKIYDNTVIAKSLIETIIKRCNEEHEQELIRLYSEEHQKENGIPIWIGIEFLSFGETLELLNSLNEIHKKEIMASLNFKNYHILYEALNSLRIVRNLCAHHGRLWNNSFYSTRKKIKGKPHIWNNLNSKRMVSYTVGILHEFLDESYDEFIKELNELLTIYKVNKISMGFEE